MVVDNSIKLMRGGAEVKGSKVVRYTLETYKKNELIFASKLYKEKLSEYINEMAYYKMLERLCKNGELAKAAKGIYYVPNISKYGVVPPSEKQIIDAFTKDETGTVVGYTLYNSLNLTTQIPKTIDVYSSALDAYSKTVRNVYIKQVQLDYTESVKNIIKSLEVLQNYYEIQDINYSAFIDYSKEIASTYEEKIFEKIISKTTYKKSTIAFLREILNYYQVSNNLEKYLSSLSTYKHPKMEEIYEFARTSRGV